MNEFVAIRKAGHVDDAFYGFKSAFEAATYAWNFESVIDHGRGIHENPNKPETLDHDLKLPLNWKIGRLHSISYGLSYAKQHGEDDLEEARHDALYPERPDNDA